MTKLRLANFRAGVSTKTGNAYACVSLMTLGKDRRISDFFLPPEVWNSAIASGVKLDDLVWVSADIDENLRFSISEIRPVTVAKD